jgi:hypothetical protein
VTEEDTERDFTVYASKDATGTMQAFADWLIEVCELEFPNGKAEDQFRFGVQLGGTLRMEFQASDYWHEDERNPRSPAGQKARAAANGAKAKAAKAKAAEAEADEDEDEDEDEAPAKPARRGRAAAGKAPAGKASTAKAPARRGRGRAAASSGEGTEAPY